MPVFAEHLRDLRMRKQLSDLESAAFYGVDEDSGHAVNDLRWNSAHGAANCRLPFPQRFSHGQAKALAQRLLHDQCRRALLSIDFECRPRRQDQDNHVRVVACRFIHFL